MWVACAAAIARHGTGRHIGNGSKRVPVVMGSSPALLPAQTATIPLGVGPERVEQVTNLVHGGLGRDLLRDPLVHPTRIGQILAFDHRHNHHTLPLLRASLLNHVMLYMSTL